MDLAHRLFHLPSAMLRHFRVKRLWLASALYAGDVRGFLKLLVHTPRVAVKYAWGFVRDNS